MEEVYGSTNSFIEKIKLHWKKYLLITVIILVLIFLFYPRVYSYNLNDTCNSQNGIVSARCIGLRMNFKNYQEQTINGNPCNIYEEGQRCIGLSLFEKFN
jgi:hypothetical protein